MNQMEKLQSVPQESKSDYLQSGPAPPIQKGEQLPCQWVLQKQDRKGQLCGKPTFNGNIYCPPHEIKISQKGEVIHEVNASQQLPVPAQIISPTVIHQQLPIQQVPIHYQPQQLQQPSTMCSSDVFAIFQLFCDTIIRLQDKYRD